MDNEPGFLHLPILRKALKPLTKMSQLAITFCQDERLNWVIGIDMYTLIV